MAEDQNKKISHIIAEKTNLPAPLVKEALRQIERGGGHSHPLIQQVNDAFVAVTTPSANEGVSLGAVSGGADTNKVFQYTGRDGKPVKKYIVEWDKPVSEEEQSRLKQAEKFAEDTATRLNTTLTGFRVDTRTMLLGMKFNNTQRAVRWHYDVARNLSWWFDAESFKPLDPNNWEKKAAVAEAFFTAACADWSSVCGVSFPKVDTKDTALMEVRFTDVRRDPDMAGVIAMAFFPDSPANERIVHIFVDLEVTAAQGWNPAGVLRHELGHVLGFRHEHIRRSDLPSSPGDSIVDTVPITDYDSCVISVPSAERSFFGLDRNELYSPLLLDRRTGCQ
jgi:hypothetical protein